MKKRKLSLLSALLLAAPLALTGCGSDSGDLPVPNDQAQLSGQFAGPDSCVLCHPGVHAEWQKSWHTLKASYGPAFEGQGAGLKNIHPWSLNAAQNDWNDQFLAGFHNVAILDQVGLAGAADFRADNAGSAIRTNDLILSTRTFAPSEVSIVIGQTRKQRYGVYYDGSPQQDVYLAYTRNGGIRYEIMTVETWTRGGGTGALPPARGEGIANDDAELFIRQGGTPMTFTYRGNKNRAGYKFLFTEVFLYPGSGGYATASSVNNVPRLSGDNYSESRSWQERCIGCHTTGFDYQAWDAAKEAYLAKDGYGDDLKELFVADIRVSCEACHGPGAQHARTARAEHIINPVNLTGEHRKMVCEQCHTRTGSMDGSHQGNKIDKWKQANDNRGFVLGVHEYQDIMGYVRPAWGSGSRAVSIDGKGRRDHQQDMDVRLTEYINIELEGRQRSIHGSQACFDCHTSHGVGSNVSLTDTTRLITANDPTGLIRLSQSRDQMCGQCHDMSILGLLNGRTGWPTASFAWTANSATWNTGFGRQDRKQHLFSSEIDGGGKRSKGLDPAEYIWSVAADKVGSTTQADYRAIWPWERTREMADGRTIVIGATPWAP